MPAPYDYATTTGYARTRPDWADLPTTTTPITQAQLDPIDQAIFDIKAVHKNVKDFGAKGDGTTNDTTAITNALAGTGWPSNRAALLFPPGRYVHDGTLTIDGGGASSTPPLALLGYGAELYTTTQSANPIVKVTNSIVSTTRVTFHGLIFNTNASSSVFRTGVVLNNAQLCTFHNCVFTSNFGTGIEFTGISQYNRIVNSEFVGLKRGLLLTGDSKYLQLVGCGFSEGLGGGPLNWIEASSGGSPTDQVLISSCVFRGNGATLPIIRVANGVGWSITGCNFFDSEVESIWIGQDGSSSAHTINGCTFRTGKRHDIYIDGGRRNVVSGCTFGVRAGGVATDTFAAVRIRNTFGGAAGSDNIVANCNSEDTASGLTNVVEADAGCIGLRVANILGAAGVSIPSTTVASAATVTLPMAPDTFHISGTTNITSVTASWPDRTVKLIFDGILTFTDGSNLKLAGNFVTTADDTITLVCDGTNWFEAGRSVN